MKRKQLTNFRLQRVYSPTVLKIMEESKYRWWNNLNEDRNVIIDSLKWLNPNAYKEAIDKYLDGDVSELNKPIPEETRRKSKEATIEEIAIIIGDYELENGVIGIVEKFKTKNSINNLDEIWLPMFLFTEYRSEEVDMIFEKNRCHCSKEYQNINLNKDSKV